VDDGGPGVWSTDGTATGTVLLGRLAADGAVLLQSGKVNFLQAGASAYFVEADTGALVVDRAYKLWRTDGTPAGTAVVVTNLNPGGATEVPILLGVLGNTALFTESSDSAGSVQIYAISGAGVEPQPLTTFTGGGGVRSGAIVASKQLYFVAENANYSRSIWVSDGTGSGTHQIINPYYDPLSAAGNGYENPNSFVSFGTYVGFVSPNDSGSTLLWTIDTGTETVGSITTASGTVGYGPPVLSQFSQLAPVNGLLYFVAGNLWRSDGTSAGTVSVPAPTGTTAANTAQLQAVGDRFVYVASDPQHGWQLWGSDGTANTVRLTSASQGGATDGPGFQAVTVLGDFAYYLISDGGASSASWTLWRTDGTAAGTSRVSGIAAFDARISPALLIIGDATHEFVESGGSLFKYDPAGDTLTTLAAGGSFGLSTSSALYDGRNLYFTNNDPTKGGVQPWVSDGTVTGTHIIWDLRSSLLPMTVAQSAASSNDAPVTINVLSNDGDKFGKIDPSTVRIGSAPSHGSATVNSDGTVTYTPVAGFGGSDTFTYTVSDNEGQTSLPATVTVSVSSNILVGSAESPGQSGSGGGGGLLNLLDLLVLGALASTRFRR
jgi:trimeric autotransporter adhesin